MHSTPETQEEPFSATRFLVEVKSRYIWLTTVVLALVAGLYAFILCAMIIYQCHPRPRLMVVTTIGLVFALGGVVFIWALDESHTLYRAVFGFSYDNLRQAGPQRIGEQLLRYVMVVVSVVNVASFDCPCRGAPGGLQYPRAAGLRSTTGSHVLCVADEALERCAHRSFGHPRFRDPTHGSLVAMACGAGGRQSRTGSRAG